MRVFILAMLLAASGCATRTVVDIPSLPACAEIELPKIPREAFEPITYAEYEAWLKSIAPDLMPDDALIFDPGYYAALVEITEFPEDAYVALVARDTMLRGERERLCGIIKAHNEQAK